ncbi:MAG: TIGR02757 family protein [Melioribacteraceae bacterium]|nr:TIGR02757 family protein [Melioribacteraceae bacterium]
MPSKKFLNLKRKLDYHYRAFDKKSISPDPLQFLHRYSNYYDIEIAGIIASTFSYGNITQIIATLEKLFGLFGNSPHEFIKNYDIKNDRKYTDKIVHRFFTGEDIARFFSGLQKVYTEYDSLNYMFLLYYFDADINIKESLSRFSKNLADICRTGKVTSNGLKFMFPDPDKGSACKRLNLFLRWMIRSDELDFGLWKEIPTGKLVIPVDTHIARICRELKLTKRKNISWKMAEEITENLKQFDPYDPVKYDFAICHIGMRKMEF